MFKATAPPTRRFSFGLSDTRWPGGRFVVCLAQWPLPHHHHLGSSARAAYQRSWVPDFSRRRCGTADSAIGRCADENCSCRCKRRRRPPRVGAVIGSTCGAQICRRGVKFDQSSERGRNSSVNNRDGPTFRLVGVTMSFVTSECFGEQPHRRKQYIKGCVENIFLSCLLKMNKSKVRTTKSVSLKPCRV